MKKLLIIGLSFITPLFASSFYIEEEVNKGEKNSRYVQLSEIEKDQIVDNLFLDNFFLDNLLLDNLLADKAFKRTSHNLSEKMSEDAKAPLSLVNHEVNTFAKNSQNVQFSEMEEEINTAANDSQNAQLSEIEKGQMIDNLLKRVRGSADAVLFLANHIGFFPMDVRFPQYTRQTIAINMINSLRDKKHPNFNFSLEEKENILQSIASNVQKSTPKLENEVNDSDLKWIVYHQDKCTQELCYYLLSEKGREQLLPK